MQGRYRREAFVHDITGDYHALQLRSIKERFHLVKRDRSEQLPLPIDDVNMLELVLDKSLGNLGERCVLRQSERIALD